MSGFIFEHHPLKNRPVPQSWVLEQLQYLTESIQPGFPSGEHNREKKGVPHLRPMNISRSGMLDLSELKYVVDVRPGFEVRKGDVLFNNTNSRELVGKTAVCTLDSPFVYSNHMTRLRAHNAIDSVFLAHQLHWLWMTGYFRHRCINHVNQASISSRPLAETVPIALPPLAEQRRIVAEIEKQFTRLDQVGASLARARTNLNRYRASVLKEATTRKAHWSQVCIADVADVGTGATPRRGNPLFWSEGNIPWVASAAVNSDEVTEPTEYVTQRALRQTNLTVYPPGTLLLAMYGEGKTRGKISILKISAATNQALAAILIRPDSPLTGRFLRTILLEHYVETRSMSSGGVQPNLNLGLVRSIRVDFPPSQSEQLLIVDRIERDLSVIAETQAAVNSVATQAARLRQAILAKAFSGQLVPQDPNDEPASALLERIRTERARSDSDSRRRRDRKQAVLELG